MDFNSRMVERPDISVVIPARNEQGTVAEVIRRVDAALQARGWTSEIILGDSASTDATVAAGLAAGVPVRVVSASEPGKGRVLTRGFLEARGRILAFIDADLDLSPEELPRLIEEVMGGAGCAVGAKTVADQATRPMIRRIGSRIVNLIARLLLQTGLTDHQTGMKAFSREALQPILPAVVETGWLWDTEVIWRLRRAGATATEVPVTLLSARDSRLRWGGSLDAARQVMAMYRRLILSPSRSPGPVSVAAVPPRDGA